MPDLKQLLRDAAAQGATKEQLDVIYNAYQEKVKKKDQPISKGFGIGLEPSQPPSVPTPLIGQGIIDYQERERRAQQAAEKLSNKLNTNLATYMAAQGEEPTKEMLGAQEQSAYNQLQAVIQKDLGNKGGRTGYLYNKLLQGTGAVISGGIDAGLNLMKYAQPMSPVINEATILDYRYNIAPDVKNFLREQIGAEVDKGAERKFDEEFITSAVGGLAYSVPAMVTPMGAGLYAQAYDSGLDLINSTKAGKDLTEAEKTLFASTLGVVMGTLEKTGLDRIVGRSIAPQIARNATFKAIKELSEKGVKITPEAIERVARTEANQIKNKLVNAGDQTYKAFLDEFTTGGLQELGTIGLEQSVNALKNKDIFDTQGMGEMFGRVLKSAAQEGIGGGIMGVAKGAMPVSTRGYLVKEIASAKSFDDINRLLRDVESIGIENNYAPEQIDDVVSTVNQIVQLKEKLPPQLTNAQQEGILNLIVERNELSDELQKANADLQNVDPAFADSKANEIAILEKQINAINKDIKQISEDENYAVQIETAGQVPVQPEAQVGGEVAQGEPQAEPQAPAEGVQEKIDRSKFRIERDRDIVGRNKWAINIDDEDLYTQYFFEDQRDGLWRTKAEAQESIEDFIKSREEEVAKAAASKEASAEGVQEKITIGVAPFREINVTSLDQDAELRSTPEYKNYVKNIVRISKGLGLKVDQSAETWGGYVDTETGRPVQEVSNMLQIKATPEEARVLAAILGKTAPEMQDAVLVGNFNRDGIGFEHTIKTGSFENATRAIEFLKNNGLEYFSIDKKTGDIVIIDGDGSSAVNVANFNDELNEKGITTEYSFASINAEFILQTEYDRILAEQGRKIADERGIDIDAIVKSATERFQKTRKQKVEAEPEVKAEIKKIPKGVYTELVARIERSIQNVFGKPDNKIVTLNAKQFQEALKEAQAGEDVRFQAVGAFEKINFSETPEYQQLKEEGKVVEDFDVKDIAGKPVVVISPDNMMTGVIFDKSGKPVLNGNGGLNFVSKFGEVWASSKESTANTLAGYINTAREKDLASGGDGKVYIVLIKGKLSKTLTSHTGAKAAMSVLESLSETYNLIGLKDFRSALTKVGKKYKIDFSGSDDAKSINKDIASKFFNVSDSTFKARGFFVFDMIDHLSRNSKTAQKNIDAIRDALGSSQLGKKIRLSKGGIVESLGLLFSDPVTQGVKNSNAYALIEIDKPVKIAPGKHESYPISIIQEDGSRPSLLILKNPQDIRAIANDSNNNPVPDYYINKAGQKTNTVGKFGSNQTGMAQAFIKSADQLSTDFVNYMTNEDGEVYGFEQNGNIFLNGSLLNANTPIHEAGHVWMDWVESNNPDLFFQGLEKVRGTEYIQKVKDNKFYQDQANKLPEDRRERYFETEALAKAIGDQGESIVNENKKKTIKDWLKSLWEAVGNKFGIRDMSSEDISNLTLDQFAKLAAGDILSAAEEKGIIKRPAGKLARVREGIAKVFRRGEKEVGRAIKPEEFAEFEEVPSDKGKELLLKSLKAPQRAADKIKAAQGSVGNYYNKLRRALTSTKYDIQKALDKVGSVGELARAAMENIKGSTAVSSLFSTKANLEIFKNLSFAPSVKMELMDKGKKVKTVWSERQLFDAFLDAKRIISIDARIRDKFSELIQLSKKLKDGVKNNTLNAEEREALVKKISVIKEYLLRRKALLLKGPEANVQMIGYQDPNFIYTDKEINLLKEDYEPLQYKHTDNKTMADAEDILNEIKSQHPELYKKLDDLAFKYNDAFRELLKENYDAGLIDKETYDELFSYNYIPTKFIQHFIENELSVDNPSRAKNLSASIKNLTGGSEEDVITNYQSVLDLYAHATYRRIFQNRAVKLLSKAISGIDKAKFGNQQFYIQQPSGKNKYGKPKYEAPPRGYDSIVYYENGVEKRIIAPQQFVDIWNDTEFQSAPWLDSIIGFFRKLTLVNFITGVFTKYSPVFGATQILMDAPQALITSKAYPDFFLGSILLASDYAAVAKDVKSSVSGKPTPFFIEAVRAGVFSDFLSTENDLIKGQKFTNYDGSSNIKNRVKYLISRIDRGVDKTLQTIAKFNEATEYSTRLAVYRRMKMNLVSDYKSKTGNEPTGSDLEDIKTLAANEARRIVDFSAAGGVVKPANKLLAYLNSTIQVFVSAARSLKNNPYKAGLMLAEMGLASAALLAYSLGDLGGSEEEKRKRYKEYKKRSKYERESYFLFWTGDPDRPFARLQKPPLFRGFINMFEQGYLNATRGEDFNQGEMWSAFKRDIPFGNPLAELVRNPMINAHYKYSQNYDAFREERIVKDEEKTWDYAEVKGASKLYRNIGKLSKEYGIGGEEGISPVRMQAAVESFTGDPSKNTFASLLDISGKTLLYLKDGDTKVFKERFKGGNPALDLFEASGLQGKLFSKKLNYDASFAEELERDEKDEYTKNLLINSDLKELRETYDNIDKVYNSTREYLSEKVKSKDITPEYASKIGLKQEKLFNLKDENLPDFYDEVFYADNNKKKAKILNHYTSDLKDSEAIKIYQQVIDFGLASAEAAEMAAQLRFSKKGKNEK